MAMHIDIFDSAKKWIGGDLRANRWTSVSSLYTKLKTTGSQQLDGGRAQPWAFTAENLSQLLRV